MITVMSRPIVVAICSVCGWGMLANPSLSCEPCLVQESSTASSDAQRDSQAPPDSPKLLLSKLCGTDRSAKLEALRALASNAHDFLSNPSYETPFPELRRKVWDTLEDEDPEIQLAAVEVVQKMGRTREADVSSLDRLARSPNDELKRAVRLAHMTLGGDAEWVLRMCVDALGSEDNIEQIESARLIEYLSNAGYARNDYLPLLEQILIQGPGDGDDHEDELAFELVAYGYLHVFRYRLDLPVIHAAKTFNDYLNMGFPILRGDKLYLIQLNEQGGYQLNAVEEALLRILRNPRATSPQDRDFAAVQGAARLAGFLSPSQRDGLMEHLVPLLDHPHPGVRASAAESLVLGRPGPHDAKIREILHAAMAEGSAEARLTAATAWLCHDPESRLAGETIRAALEGDDADAKRAALSDLAALGNNLPPAQVVPALIKILEGPTSTDPVIWEQRALAASALGRMGAEAKQAAPALLNRLVDRYDMPLIIDWLADTRLEATISQYLVALREIGETEETVRVMIDYLNVRQIGYAKGIYGFSHFAAEILGSAGPAAKEAVPILARCLMDEASSVRIDCALALGRLGPAAKEAVPSLIDALNDVTQYSLPRARVAAAQALWRIDRRHREAEPILVDILRHAEYYFERRDAARVLGEMGQAVSGAIPALTDALADEHPEVREAAAEAIRAVRRRRRVIASGG